ncbi:uncharacterized protein LOC121383131 [Gigantopelta aegis]|uniref:uncharacterized protein LOC121383131 n=1 Tax=Gigantopelta aegis TaxID=1735272 RepID=UPI001B88BE87|nr:uncharacterized protein LOC121383131 [Gigantopelta aegis]
MTIAQMLHLYYDRLSTASVFLEQVESEFSPYKNDVACVQRSVVGLLCQLALTLTHLKETLPNSASREAMPEIYRTLPNTASQDIRNFLISRDLSKLVNSMKTDIGRFVK